MEGGKESPKCEVNVVENRKVREESSQTGHGVCV
jgi:hypothetical protein